MEASILGVTRNTRVAKKKKKQIIRNVFSPTRCVQAL